jgi:hypothetical protein
MIDSCDGMGQKERRKESETADDGFNHDRAEYTQGMCRVF